MQAKKPAMRQTSSVPPMSALLFFAFSALIATTEAAPSSTRSQPPFIVSVSPNNVGSVEGGTRLTITGANFAQEGLFSSRAVFIGGQACQVINYYTTNERIVCITPKCVSPACLSDADWQGSESASLSVYVSTVEGILEGFSTFTYHGGYTPSIYKMQHNAWATGMSQMTTKLLSTYLSDLSIKIGDHFADLGNGDEFNNDRLDFWSRSSLLYYRAPTDKTAGYFNLSLTANNDPSNGNAAAGLARMYPIQESFLYDQNYQYDYNYGMTLAGVPYSIGLLPVITDVSPRTGSVAGGTVLTVRGHGFSALKENMIVYAAGQPCDVLSTGSGTSAGKTEVFTCRTRSAKPVPDLRSQLLSATPVEVQLHGEEVTFQDNFFTEADLELPSARNYGSAGWWLKMYDSAAYYANAMVDSNVRLSMGIRQPLSFSLNDLFGGNLWASALFYDSKSGDPLVFASDVATYLVAPYTGTYYFYASVDDLANVYGRRVILLPDGTEQFGPEELLVSATYNVNSEGNFWPTCSGCKPARSKGISLLLGERYQLRVRFVNTGGADQIAVAMKIELPGHTEQVAAPRPTAQPVFVNTSQPSMSPTYTLTGAPTRTPTHAPTLGKPSTNPTRTPTRLPSRAPTARPSVGPTLMPTYLTNQGNYSMLPEEVRVQQRVMSNSFLRHHSLKDTQIIALKLPFFYEIQSLTVTGVTGGTFKLVLQEIMPTADLTLSSSTTAIANALNAAANQLADYNVPVECYNFAVTKAVIANGLQLNITFQVANYYEPLSRTVFYTDDFIGAPVTTYKVIQHHSLLAQGNMQLSVIHKQQVLSTPVSIYATQRDMQLALNALSKDFTVDVTRRGDYYNGYIYTVAFLTPVGYIEPVIVDVSQVENLAITATVTKAENGSTSSLWFRYIPTYMTEVPLSWALTRTATTPAPVSPASGVEVYVQTPEGDVVKAVCDGAPLTNNVVLSMFKGSEQDCSYHFATNVTAVVSHLAQDFDPNTGSSSIDIFGANFLLPSRAGNFSSTQNYAIIPMGYADIDITLAGHACNVTMVTDTHIVCDTTNTPSGQHVPIVNIVGYGDALMATNLKLTFLQQIHSIEPNVGSLAGGQIVTVRGTGFHPSTSEVTFSGVEGTCSVMSATSVQIVCRTPAYIVEEHHARRLEHFEENLIDNLLTSHVDTSARTVHAHSNNLHLQSDPLTPSAEPTAEPTAEPSAQPTEAPSGGIIGTQYHVQVLVDGRRGSEYNAGVNYTFAEALTPVVYSITPFVTSPAVTTNLTITGINLVIAPHATTVTVAGQECSNVRLSTNYLVHDHHEQTITCVLGRTRNFGPYRVVEVEVDVPAYGFAGRNHSLSELPTIERGFEIGNISPSIGSVMGNNEIVIQGSGFGVGNMDLYSVTLRKVGMPIVSEYDALLVNLGFPASVQPLASEVIQCPVVSVTETEVTCIVPGHATVYPEYTYDVTVTVNSIASECRQGSQCQYAQARSHTPALEQMPTVLDTTAKGEMTLQLFGTLLSDHSDTSALRLFVGGLECTILQNNAYGTESNRNLTVRTPPLPAGVLKVTANVQGYGDAFSKVNVTAGLAVYSADFAAFEGSVAGGTNVVVHGKGFSTNCFENTVHLHVVRASTSATADLLVTEFSLCTTTEMHLWTPTLLPQLPANAPRNTQDRWDLSTVTVAGLNNAMTVTTAVTNFAYALAATPMVLVNATMGYQNTPLRVVVFSKLNTLENSVNVTIGGEACDLQRDLDVSESTIAQQHPMINFYARYCAAPALPASNTPYPVLVRVFPLGYALTNTTANVELPAFKSLFSIQSLPAPLTVSVKSGRKLTLSGTGLTDAVKVNICEKECVFGAGNVTYNSLVCDIPERLTTTTIDTIQSSHLDIDLIETVTGTYFSSLNNPSSPLLAAVSDNDFTTFFAHNSLTCSVGIKLPTGYKAQPHRMRFYPRFTYSTSINNYVYEGSMDGGTTFTTIATSSKAHEGWNLLNAPADKASLWYNAFRYRAADTSSSSRCYLAEVEFLGIIGATESTCSVSVAYAASAINTVVGSVVYGNVDTFVPVITSLFPNNGSALGGDTVTITGTHFDAYTAQNPDNLPLVVEFSGVECVVTQHTATSITCVTSPRTPDQVRMSSIVVNVPGRGIALVGDDVSYLYIDDWSALTSWRNQEPPVEGDFVWIPDGQVLNLDVKTPILSFLLVEGDLYFDRRYDVSVDSSYILILGGYMEVGTEENPFEKSAVITLHGSRYGTIEIPAVGSKVLAVAGRGLTREQYSPGQHMPGRHTGQLEVHGRKRLRTWTKLSTTAYSGQSWLLVSEPVDFKSGEKVILTGSERPGSTMGSGFDASSNYGLEELTVLSTSTDGLNVTFTTALRFTHRSEIVTIEGRTVDMRISIGLLSRNVVIQGDDVHSDGDLFGVHTIAFMSGIYRMENAEIRRCGQAFNFGRYCTHSHMAGNMITSYVKANSIHHSYQRAVTTHDTNNWEVRDNVAYDITGHAYFMEDGTETNNYITGNLGVHIRRSSALLKSDMKPAVFWTATPSNFWRDNVACHSTNFGFWFELEGRTDEGNCPVGQSVGEHVNNTYHSNGDIGLRIYPIWLPSVNPCVESSGPQAQYMYTLTSFRNGGNGIFGKSHGSIHHIDYNLIENGGDAISIVKLENVVYDKDPHFVRPLIVATLEPNFNAYQNVGKFAIFAPQREFFYVQNATIVNFGSTGALTGCNECLVGAEMNQGGLTTRYEGLKFVNTTRRIYWSDTKKEILWDLDGSLAGVPDSMITKSYGHLKFDDECTVLTPESTYSDSIRCGSATSSVRIRRMQLESVTPSQLSYTDLVVRSSAGEGEFYFLPLDTYGWVFPVVTGGNRSYSLHWRDAGISAYTLRFRLGRDPYLLESINSIPRIDETVRMDYQPHMWDYLPYSFGVTYNNQRKLATFNNTRPLQRMADAQYKNTTISVVLSTRGYKASANPKFGVYLDSQLCPPKGCPVPPVPSIGRPMLWSKKDSWQSKTLPVAGQKVTIDSNMWIVMDITPPNLGSLVINGKLSFLSNATHPRSLSLTVKDIAVYGIFEISGGRDRNNNNATLPFVGDASVTVYGTKGSSLPIVMGEGVYLGAKVIGVSGEFIAHGATRTYSWTRLRATVSAHTSEVQLSQYVDWRAGDEVLLSPTAYFNEVGGVWSNKKTTSGSSDEIITIASVRNATDSVTHTVYSILTLTRPTNHTHLCTTKHGETFCGAVGLMTRNIRFQSRDSETPGVSSYGFGANLHIFDLIPKTGTAAQRRGSAYLNGVMFKNFGKINSDRYAIQFQYTDYKHPASTITNCAFNAGYSLAARASHTMNFTFTNNVASGNWGGGIFVTDSNINFEVSDNLIVGTRQLPSTLLSSYPWLRPIAGITVHSPHGVVMNNLAAGSEGEGFAIATAMLHLPDMYNSFCRVTNAKQYHYDSAIIHNHALFLNNEAVACRDGLFVVAMGPGESQDSDCAVVTRFKAWRSGHTGILGIDAQAQILIEGVLLAENHIGITIHSFKGSERLFNGVIKSKIIGSLVDTSVASCDDLADSKYIRNQECNAFTQADPLGVLNTCNSVIHGIYKRVGILLPQWTNAAQTCAMAGRFETCEPPNTPDRLCLLPWEKRYGLPVDIAYAEQHIHDVTFLGFHSREVSGPDSTSSCIPSATSDRSVAVAVNPSQFDMQPTVISSGLTFSHSDVASRFGFDTGTYAVADCTYKPCAGLNMILFHDLDGSANSQNVPAQMTFKNPSYVAPFPLCYEAPDMSVGLFLCPRSTADPVASNATVTTEFRQYTALWRDWGPQIIQPIVTTRQLASDNRSFASFGPIDDMCAKRFFFSRFPMMFAVGVKHKVVSTGTIPNEFLLRWDAPSVNDATVVEFFVQHSQVINVLVSNNPFTGFKAVPKGFEYPTVRDPAGTNMRDPYKRILAVTLRGGEYRYYRFRMVFVASVTIRMDMTLATFFSNTFVANMATLLRITADRIKITDVRAGSVIADFDVSPSPQNAVPESPEQVLTQIAELNALTGNLSTAVATGEMAKTLNVSIMEVYAIPPIVPVVLDQLLYVAENDTSFNITAYREAQIFVNTPQTAVLLTFPTSQPSSHPTGQPSSRPSKVPSAQPSSSPSSQPTSMPSTPTSHPSSKPSSQPSAVPTLRPSSQPTSSPSEQPTSHPTSTPTRSPRPTSQPSTSPTSVPSSQPVGEPTQAPVTSNPTSQPSSSTPSSQPSSSPTSEPSSLPSSAPSAQPLADPTSRPTSQPSTSKPSSTPSGGPTQQPISSAPSSHPSSQPSGSPTAGPSSKPTSRPVTSGPTSHPSGEPTGQPVSHPTSHPTAQPSSKPSGQPSPHPTHAPTTAPTAQPTPTRAPFVAATSQTEVTFECGTDLIGITEAEFKGDTSAADAFKDAIANVTNSDGVTTLITITSVVDTARRQLSSSSKVALDYTVLLTIIRQYAVGTTFNASDAANSAYNNFRATLLSALSDSSFADALKRSGVTLFNNVSADPNSFRISPYQMNIVDLSPTAAPTQASNNDNDRLNAGEISGIVIGGFAFLVLVGALIYYYFHGMKRNTSAKEVKVVPNTSNDDAFNMDQVYSPNDTVSPLGNNLPRGSMVRTDAGDAAVLWETGSDASAEEANVPLTPVGHSLSQFIQQQFSEKNSQSQAQLRYSVGTTLGQNFDPNASVKSLNSVDLDTAENNNNIVYDENMDIEEKGRTPTVQMAMRKSGSGSAFDFNDAAVTRPSEPPVLPNPFNEPPTPETDSHPFFAPELFPNTGEALAPQMTDLESRGSMKHHAARDSWDLPVENDNAWDTLVPAPPVERELSGMPQPGLPVFGPDETLSENPMLRAQQQSQPRDDAI